MTTGNEHKPMLDGCDVLPPMEPSKPTGEQPKPKQKASRRKTGDRFAVINDFVDTELRNLSNSETVVWLVLWRDTRNGVAQTSQADIARRAGVSSRTVRYAINRLTKRGLLALVFRGGLNRGISKYRVLTNSHGERRQ